jgi:nitrite reductase (NADH) small subunit/3-phenylpropionate/trans-cinnamate dioxygenase ferredoxin subunit
MSEFHTVAKVGDIPEGEGRSFSVAGTMVGLFLHKGEYLAINDFCPHMGASLAEGHVTEEGAVMCPWHAWCFSLKDGTWLDNSRSGICTPTYPVQVQGDEIQVAVPPPETRPGQQDSQPDDDSSRPEAE